MLRFEFELGWGVVGSLFISSLFSSILFLAVKRWRFFNGNRWVLTRWVKKK
jgi:hypothetical protein